MAMIFVFSFPKFRDFCDAIAEGTIVLELDAVTLPFL